MGAAIKAGLGLTAIIWVMQIGWILCGLHERIFLGLLFVVIAIVLNVLALVWALRQTRQQNGYGKQFLCAVVMGVVAAVAICGVSMVSYTVLFPEAIDEQKAAVIDWLEGSSMPEQVRAAQIKKTESTTALASAMQGLYGTVGTSVIVGAIVAAFVRKKN